MALFSSTIIAGSNNLVGDLAASEVLALLRCIRVGTHMAVVGLVRQDGRRSVLSVALRISATSRSHLSETSPCTYVRSNSRVPS